MLKSEIHSNGIVVQLSGRDGQAIDDRDVAAALAGSGVEVLRSALPQAQPGQYYWFDLLGLQVNNLQAVALGKVSDMTSNGAQDVMVVQDGERERLIPFVAGPIVKNVDLAAGLIICDWQPEYDEN